MKIVDSNGMIHVNDIFESISGEAGIITQGTWVTGIRLQGCNLRCKYCDAPEAQDVENLHYELTPQQIIKMVKNKNVLLTGGEPLIQKGTISLIRELISRGHRVQIETNGRMEIPVIEGACWVIDRKCPSSAMSEKMMSVRGLVQQLKKHKSGIRNICLKWVVDPTDIEDVIFALAEISELNHFHGVRIPFIISPIIENGWIPTGALKPLVEMIKEHDPSLLNLITFSVQLHKILNMP